jgi:hypothetical protein
MEDDYTIADLLSTLADQYRRQITGSTRADNRIRLEMVRRLALISQSIKGLMKSDQNEI